MHESGSPDQGAFQALRQIPVHANQRRLRHAHRLFARLLDTGERLVDADRFPAGQDRPERGR